MPIVPVVKDSQRCEDQPLSRGGRRHPGVGPGGGEGFVPERFGPRRSQAGTVVQEARPRRHAGASRGAIVARLAGPLRAGETWVSPYY